MTKNNEQIIIDGVDVTPLTFNQLACMNTDEVARLFVALLCMFKTKEQECERLKGNNAQFIKDNEFLAERNSKLKKENEELRMRLDERMWALSNVVAAENNCIKQLRQTLTEIKKIALEACLCCGECRTEFSTKDYCDYNEILQKINEVIDGN